MKDPLPVSTLGRNPPTCYPKNTLSAQDLLPQMKTLKFNNLIMLIL